MEIGVKALKYFLLSLAGCTIAYFIALVLGIYFIADIATAFLTYIAAKVAALIGCLLAIAVITESIRY
jgi:membrane protein DedA with SNARE-associated domain